MGTVPEGKDEAKLQELVSAMLSSRRLRKSTYASWIRHLEERAGRESEVEVEGLLSYLLSWFLLSSRLEDGINPFVLLMAIILANRERVALPVNAYIPRLVVRQIGRVSQQHSCIGRYDVVTHADTGFANLLVGALRSKCP